MKTVRVRYGVIPYRHVDDDLEVALITRRSHPEHWGVPKGRLEAGRTPYESAAREAYEEGGVVGPVGMESIGAYGIPDPQRKPQRVEVFLMHVTDALDDWPEREERSRCWLPVDQAARLVHSLELASLVHGLSLRLAVGTPRLHWAWDLLSRAAA